VEPHQLPWSPLDPAALPDLLAGVGAPWWLAGGWAIDAFVGRVTRVHEDIDVLVLRRDQAAFRSALTSWTSTRRTRPARCAGSDPCECRP